MWTRILIRRHQDATIFAAPTAKAAPDEEAPAKSAGAGITKNLILFVGTGYGIVPMTATRIYASGEDGLLAIDRLPETALVRDVEERADRRQALPR